MSRRFKSVGFLAITVVVVTSLFISFPQSANAQFGLMVPTNDIINNAKETGIGGFSLDTIAWQFAKGIIRQITTNMVNWINSGFNGNPTFVSNPGQLFSSIANNIAGNYINQLGLGQTLCSPFSLQIRLALEFKYGGGDSGGGNGGLGQSSCSLSDIISNVKNAQVGVSVGADGSQNSSNSSDDSSAFVNGNFDSGGWDSWFAMTQDPDNNPYGEYIQADQAIQNQISAAVGEQAMELNWGQGFQSVKDALGNILTPGSVILSQLNSTLAAPVASLVSADELNEVIGALGGQLLGQLFGSGGGLAGLSTKDASGNSIANTWENSNDLQAEQQVVPAPNVPSSGCVADQEVNYALRAQAAQVNSGDKDDAGPDAAVDGQKSNNGSSFGIAISKSVNPWWQVDLGAVETVDKIRIYPRAGTQLNNFYIFTSANKFPSNDLDTLKTAPGVTAKFVGNVDTSPIEVAIGPTARYVRIQSDTGGDSAFLQLVEVEVWGNQHTDCPPTDTTGQTGSTGTTDTTGTTAISTPGPSPAPQALPVKAKLVTDFGATPNDNQDDTAAIKAAAAAAGGGGIVGFPAGTYNINNGPELPSNIQYLGANATLSGKGSNGYMMTFTGDNVTLKGFTLNGGGIYLNASGGSHNIDISWNTFNLNTSGSENSAITFLGGGLYNSTITNNYFTGYNGSFGIFSFTSYHNITIANNECVNITACMHLDATSNSSDALIEQNYMSGLRGMGMEFQDNGNNMVFQDNWYENPDPSTFSSPGCKNNSDCRVMAYSLPLDKGSNITIRRNGVYAPQRPDNIGTRVGFEIGGNNTSVTDNYINYINRAVLESGCQNTGTATVSGNHFENFLGTMIENNSCKGSNTNNGPTVQLTWDTNRPKPGIGAKRYPSS